MAFLAACSFALLLSKVPECLRVSAPGDQALRSACVTIHRHTGISALVSLVLLHRHDRRIPTMQHTQKLVRLLALLAVVGLAALALPLSAEAGVRVSVGTGVPVYPRPSWLLPRRW